MNTFIIVKIMQVRDSLEDKSRCFLSTSKRSSLSLYLGTLFTDYCFILKVTRVFPYSYTGKVDQRMVNTLLMIKINPTCKRLLIFICQEKNRNLACITNKQVINGQICFFIGVALKLAVLVSWHNSLLQQCPCANLLNCLRTG